MLTLLKLGSEEVEMSGHGLEHRMIQITIGIRCFKNLALMLLKRRGQSMKCGPKGCQASRLLFKYYVSKLGGGRQNCENMLT